MKRGERGVGGQHVEPVKARVFGDPRLVDGEVLGRDGLEIAAETAVADERLVAPRFRRGQALGELGAQPVEDGTALLGIAPRLGEIATDDDRRLPILTCLASSSVSSPETRGTTSGTKGV